MAEYEYTGPGPVEDPQGEIVHPGDVRDFPEEPSWGPWRLLDGGAESDSPPPGTQPPAPAPASPPAASVTPPVTTSTPPAADTKGM